jgi:hypothetical protein
MMKTLRWVTIKIISLIFFIIILSTSLTAQTQRNPVLEEFTGTWCPWCPCGHTTMQEILDNMPNAIMIGYHGPANGSDPYSFFPGNSIIGMFGVPFWPSGAVDRTGAPDDRGTWTNLMNQRYNVPATVSIEVLRAYNPINKELNAIVDVTALENLTGGYKMTMILLEDGLISNQAGNGSCPGGANYVHKHVVRAMVNGATGEDLNSGNPWNTGEKITKTIQYVIPEEVNPDSCRLVVLVHEDQSPVYNGEIQQAIELPFINPNYSATISQMEEYYFGSSSQTAQYTAHIKNTGLLPDTYNVSLLFDGPSGWAQTFTTVNGTFNLGDTDTLTLIPGDSSEVIVSMIGNSVNGFGKTMLQFYSEQGSFGSAEFRYTTFGLDVLVVDDDGGNDYENYMENELLILASEYGIITSDFIPANVASINTFDKIIWNTAATEPGISTDEMNALITFLDNGGNLYLNGVDLAYQMADPTSPYYTSATHDFFNNYLHSSYVLKEHSAKITQGIDGDPITDSLDILRLTGGSGANTINHSIGKYANQISASGPDAFNILHFWLKPDEYSAVRAIHNGMFGIGRVVFTTFGFETISEAEVRSLFAERVISWLSSPTSVEETSSILPVEFVLSQNYPNPFNPITTIKFSVPETSPVTIKVFDVLGNEVAVLLDEVKSAGVFKLIYDASETASGIYFYQMKAGNFISVKKMSILK